MLSRSATRAIDRFDRTWAYRDWEAIAALHAPGFRYDDRLVPLDLDREHIDIHGQLSQRLVTRIGFGGVPWDGRDIAAPS